MSESQLFGRQLQESLLFSVSYCLRQMSAAFLTEISEKDLKLACPSQQLKFRKAPNSAIIRSAAAQLCI